MIKSGVPLIHSATAAASLSMADANFDGVKHHDPIKIDAENQTMTVLISIVAIACLASGLFAMWTEASIVAFVAFAFPLLTAPAVVTQRRKLQWLPSKYNIILDF